MSPKKVVIIGSGPAGLTAAIYTARAGLKPLVLEGFQSGGQLMITTEVENYPGFQQGINGPDLISGMRSQAERFGADMRSEDVTRVDFSSSPKKIWVEEELIEADVVIVSTGARANLMGLENEIRLMGKGVSACATCDGFFFQDRTIAVVGGGDSAMEEAIFLTTFAKKVFVIHRRDQFRASRIMIERASRNPKIEFVMESVVEDILGENHVTGVELKNPVSGEKRQLPLEGVFVAIGHTPNTRLFSGQLDLDKKGYIITSSEKTRQTATSVSGVFACGDVQDPHYRQAITAAGSGCKAAIDAQHYLENME